MDNQRIRELFGQVPYWADKTIREYQPVENLAPNFITESYWSCFASVNLGELRGMANEAYAGQSWRQLLATSGKMAINLRAWRDNPSYYTELAERRPSMSFSRVNGRLYVSGDGCCRAAIGKFYLEGQASPYLHNVELREYTADFEYMNVFADFQDKRPPWLTAQVIHFPGHRDDGSGWHHDYYQEIVVHVTDARDQSLTIHDKFSLAALVAGFERKPAGLFGKIFRRAA